MVVIEIDKIMKAYKEIRKVINKNTAKKIEECINNEILKERGVIKRKFDCKSRYCPICSNKLKLKEFQRIENRLNRIKKKDYLLLTLNGKNVTKRSIRKEIENNNRAFKLLIRKEIFKKIVLGYIKIIEISYIKEKNNYLPHLHIILVVKKSYRKIFRIKQERKELKEIWEILKKFKGLSVNIQSVQNIEKVIRYITTSKKKKITEMESEEMKAIIKSISGGKRLYSYGGILANKKMASPGRRKPLTKISK